MEKKWFTPTSDHEGNDPVVFRYQPDFNAPYPSDLTLNELCVFRGAPQAWAKTKPVGAWLGDVRLQIDVVARRSFAAGAVWNWVDRFLAAAHVVVDYGVADCGVVVRVVAGYAGFAFDPDYYALVLHAVAVGDFLLLRCAARYFVSVRVPVVADAELRQADWSVAQSCLFQPRVSRA